MTKKICPKCEKPLDENGNCPKCKAEKRTQNTYIATMIMCVATVIVLIITSLSFCLTHKADLNSFGSDILNWLISFGDFFSESPYKILIAIALWLKIANLLLATYDFIHFKSYTIFLSFLIIIASIIIGFSTKSYILMTALLIAPYLIIYLDDIKYYSQYSLTIAQGIISSRKSEPWFIFTFFGSITLGVLGILIFHFIHLYFLGVIGFFVLGIFLILFMTFILYILFYPHIWYNFRRCQNEEEITLFLILFNTISIFVYFLIDFSNSNAFTIFLLTVSSDTGVTYGLIIAPKKMESSHYKRGIFLLIVKTICLIIALIINLEFRVILFENPPYIFLIAFSLGLIVSTVKVWND